MLCLSGLLKAVARHVFLTGEQVESVRYDPSNLKAVEKLGSADKALSVYGSVVERVLQMGEVGKEEVEKVIKEVLSGQGVEKRFFGNLIALLYNDLRRLGVLTVGHGESWEGREKARLTSLGAWLTRCAGLNARVLGAVAVASCYLRRWEVDPEEAGFCRRAYEGKLEGYKELVRRAVEIFYNEAPPWCIPYGSDFKKAIALLTSSAGSPSGLTTA